MKPNHRIALGVLFSSLWLWGCATMSPPFDQTALDQAVNAKAAAVALMGRATEPYAQHEATATALRGQVETAALYAASRPKNKTAAEQWEIMKDPNANLLMGFLSRWQARGQLSPAFIAEATDAVSEGFDKIIGLEQARRTP